MDKLLFDHSGHSEIKQTYVLTLFLSGVWNMSDLDVTLDFKVTLEQV